MELIRDLRSHGVVLAAKALLVGLLALAVYNVASFAQSTGDAVNRSFSDDAEVNLYSLVDTLTDPDAFSEFRESREALDSLAGFYNALDAHPELTYLSAFDQNVPVQDFAGGDQHDAGNGMPSGIRGTYEDPATGATVRDVKSMQINRDTFEFYNLRVGSGEPISWESVDYGSGRIPVLLGNSYEGVYDVGDTLHGNLYSENFVLEVRGILEPASSMFYRNEINFYLDDYLVMPYPPTLDGFEPEQQFFHGILYFAMLNGDVTAPSDMTTDDLLDELLTISRSTGFAEYSLIDVPTYLVQFTLVKRIVQENLALVVSIELMLAVVVLGMVVAANVHLAHRRRRRRTVLWTLGYDRRSMTRTLAGSLVVEALLTLGVFVTGFALLPNKAAAPLGWALVGLAVYAALDARHQWHLLHRLLTPTDLKDARPT